VERSKRRGGELERQGGKMSGSGGGGGGRACRAKCLCYQVEGESTPWDKVELEKSSFSIPGDERTRPRGNLRTDEKKGKDTEQTKTVRGAQSGERAF